MRRIACIALVALILFGGSVYAIEPSSTIKPGATGLDCVAVGGGVLAPDGDRLGELDVNTPGAVPSPVPSTPDKCRYYFTGINKFNIRCEAGAEMLLALNPMTGLGDLLGASSGGDPCRVAPGANGTLLAWDTSGTCGVTPHKPPDLDADLTCDGASLTATNELTIATLPDYDNTGRGSVINCSFSFTSSSSVRDWTFRLKLEGATVATYEVHDIASSSKGSVALTYLDSTSASARTVTVTAAVGNGTGTTGTVETCACTRVTY